MKKHDGLHNSESNYRTEKMDDMIEVLKLRFVLIPYDANRNTSGYRILNKYMI